MSVAGAAVSDGSSKCIIGSGYARRINGKLLSIASFYGGGWSKKDPLAGLEHSKIPRDFVV